MYFTLEARLSNSQIDLRRIVSFLVLEEAYIKTLLPVQGSRSNLAESGWMPQGSLDDPNFVIRQAFRQHFPAVLVGCLLREDD